MAEARTRKIFVNLAVRDPQDQGVMYGSSFYDLDMHHWEVVWMDPAAAPQ